jgi:hypothetical protein
MLTQPLRKRGRCWRVAGDWFLGAVLASAQPPPFPCHSPHARRHPAVPRRTHLQLRHSIVQSAAKLGLAKKLSGAGWPCGCGRLAAVHHHHLLQWRRLHCVHLARLVDAALAPRAAPTVRVIVVGHGAAALLVNCLVELPAVRGGQRQRHV